jgi:uncharacterized Zn-finger protein
MDIKRFETTVVVDLGGLSITRKGVVYAVRFNDNKDDRETILLAANHRWREGYLMVVMSNRDIDKETAHKLIDYFVNAYIACRRCLRKWDGAVSFRIDIKGKYGEVTCAYCDPTIYDMVLPFDYQEVAREACKHKHD